MSFRGIFHKKIESLPSYNMSQNIKQKIKIFETILDKVPEIRYAGDSVLRQGMIKSEKFDGFKARLYQHEESHLRGRLNIDDAVSGGIQFVTFDPSKEQLRDIK